MTQAEIELATWTPRAAPDRRPLTGRSCRLDPLDAANDVAALFDAYAAAPDSSDWDFLPYGPFSSSSGLHAWIDRTGHGDDPLFYSIRRGGDTGPTGLVALMRIDVSHGVIEVGHVHFARALQRTVAATESIALLMAHVFDDLGYRRLEWKCDAANARSMHAAERFGFTFEGVFRNHRVVKGRNRDTAWFSLLDHEWPAAKAEFARWLDPMNFDAAGGQQSKLRLARTVEKNTSTFRPLPAR